MMFGIIYTTKHDIINRFIKLLNISSINYNTIHMLNAELTSFSDGWSQLSRVQIVEKFCYTTSNSQYYT